jgi:signal transduction histidine kinase
MMATSVPAVAASLEVAAARVLVIDDDPSVLISIQGVLELDGYAVLGVASGQQALELVSREAFDLVLTDLCVDEVDGLAILRAAFRNAPDTIGILLTGFASLETAVRALEEGAYAYLIKPCEVVDLRTTVARGLERARLQRELRERVHDLEAANETIRVLNLELEARIEEATAELREQIQLRDDFMASVSHDLKSPLTFIKGLANLRRRRANATQATRPLLDALEQIESSASRMARQLDALVDASRLQAGRPLELRREPTDLVSLAREVAREHQETTDRHVVQVQASQAELIGEWDAARLERVLSNLLNNAIKYSPRGGAVRVRVDTADHAAIVQVEDHGEGIPTRDLPHIFERFRRGGNVEHRIPGTGIGLAGARQIVELHGGTILAESRVGQGSTFTVQLPL